MSDLRVVPADLRKAADRLRDAATRARGCDSSRAISQLAGGLPGSTAVTVLSTQARSWDSGVDNWAASVDQFADGLDQAAADAQRADEIAAAVTDHFTRIMTR